MGVCGSAEEISGKTRRLQLEAVAKSKKVNFFCDSPLRPVDWADGHLFARELETVLTVLGRVAVNLGLDDEHGKLLKMVFNENVVPHNSTVRAAGLGVGSHFGVSLEGLEAHWSSLENLEAHVRGINMVKMRTTPTSDEDCVAAGATPGTQFTFYNGEYTAGVRLVCKWAPERVHSDKDEDGRGPLHEAAKWNATGFRSGNATKHCDGFQSTAMELLLAAKATVEAPTNDGNTPLHYAAENDSVEAMELLLDAKASVETANDYGQTVLHWATTRNMTKSVELLLAVKAPLETKDNLMKTTPEHCGRTALVQAVDCNSTEVLQLLLAAKASVHTKSFCSSTDPLLGHTPVHTAAIKNNVEPMKLLLAAKAEIGVMDKHRMTPLHHAAKLNHLEALELLVAVKAPVDTQNTQFGGTALHYAAIRNSTKAAQALVAARASVEIKDTAGCTALDDALERKSAEVLELLQEEQRRISGIVTSSELMQLVCTSPEPEGCIIEAYELETVLTVLGRVALTLGLDEEAGKLLQMVFSENEVPHNSTLQAAGLCDQAQFHVLGVDKAHASCRSPTGALRRHVASRSFAANMKEEMLRRLKIVNCPTL